MANDEKLARQAKRDTFMTRWKSLAQSRDFWADWEKLKEDYADVKSFIDYIESEWLSCKEEVFDFFMDKLMHLGVKVTSSNEGAHAVLKRFLNDRAGNLLNCLQSYARSYYSSGAPD